NQIPAHTYTGFGMDNLATHVDYFEFQYTTGDIPVQSVWSQTTGQQYQIHRSVWGYYDGHDPELTYYHNPFNGSPSVSWLDTLTLDRVGVHRARTWAFSPHASPANNRGFSLLGAKSDTSDTGG